MTGNTAISLPGFIQFLGGYNHYVAEIQKASATQMSKEFLGTGVTFCATDWFTFHIFHNHAQVAPCFKGTIHADHKGVLCKSQDIPFHKSLLDLVSEDEVLFINLLHGKPLPGFFMPNKVDCPEKEHKSWGSPKRGCFWVK